MTNKKARNLFISLLFLSILILIFNDNLDYSRVRQFFRLPVKPFISALDFVSEINGRRMSEDILMEYLAGEMMEKSRLLSFEKENELLRSMMGFGPSAGYSLLQAEVTGGNQSDESEIIINRGSADGVKEGMAVLFLDGIVGKVVECLERSSVVETHSNMNFKIGVCDSGKKYFMVAYFYSKGVLKVENIQYDFKMEEGETLYTSGFGNIYPPEIMVGTVKKAVRSEDGEWFYLITPSERIAALKFVFVAKRDSEALPLIFTENARETLGELGWYRIYRRSK